MTETLPYFDPRILSKLEGVTLRTRVAVEGFVAGLHRSPFRGFAAEFAEHREYAPGDDLRYVDWKVFGRSDRVFVKEFEAETNFACHVLLDASESMQFRSAAASRSKLEYAKFVAAAISYVIVKQQDAIGLITFDEAIQQTVRPASQASHWKQISHVLEQTQPQPTRTEVSRIVPVRFSALPEVADRLSRRGVVILLSDLFADRESLFLGLKALRHRKHDVRVWQIVDPAEEDFPFDAPTLFRGLEGWADAPIDPRLLRDAYREAFFAHREAVQGQCADLEIPFAVVRTDQPVELVVKHWLAGDGVPREVVTSP